MKKTSILLGLMTAGLFATAQTRMSLYEEFTGENCGPCAATNPGLNTLLNANPNKVIAIKWQVPIPSAPSATWSLYQTNKGEIDWRWKPTTSPGYGYPQTLSTPTAGYINSAPNGRMDGQQMNAFGLTSNHPGNLTQTAINNAQAMSTPFTIAMTTSWNPTFTNCVVNVSVTASSTFAATGNLMYRLVLVERQVNFATAPGTNGEKDFSDPVRKCYSTVASGTTISGFGDLLPATWTASQTQTLSISCNIPTYINDLSQMAFVGFIQDDGNKKVWQAARTAQPSIPDDAKLTAINMNQNVSCTNITPTIAVNNAGPNAITAMTITPYIDGVAQTNVTWTGNLASASNTNIALGTFTSTQGAHTFSATIVGVNAGDINMANNTSKTAFGISSNITTPPVTQAFTSFPPANWYVVNPNFGSNTWGASSASGYGSGTGSARYDFYNNGTVGDADDLVFPAMNLTGISNPNLSFDHAYTSYSGESDKLEVKVSVDCGTTWTTVFNKAGSALQTAPTTTASFVPSATQWTTNIISLPTAANQANVLVKFVATSDYGNYLYVDNVNLGQSVSIKQYNENALSFDVYPNPATTSAVIKAYSATDADATVTVYNTLGQVVNTMPVKLAFGTNEVALNTSELAAGVYNVVLNTNKGTVTKKLTVTK